MTLLGNNLKQTTPRVLLLSSVFAACIVCPLTGPFPDSRLTLL
jgi:hypothetical protein